MNKIIAEFMGCDPYCDNCGHSLSSGDGCGITVWRYSENFISLDALIPVWLKLKGTYQFNLLPFKLNGHEVEIWHDNFELLENVFHKESIQEAAAHATCKAIMELSK